jgi:hypothetical protein
MPEASESPSKKIETQEAGKRKIESDATATAKERLK